MIFLDHNATTPVRPEVLEAMAEVYAAGPLNASSVHAFGREAKKRLEAARRTLAEAVSAFPHEVVFTASGSEANNLALRGIAGARVFTSAIEHSSVLKTAVSLFRRNDGEMIIPVTTDGVINLEALEKALHAFTHQASRTTHHALLSLMLANNETGVIQPVAEAAKIARKYGALTHCDAVQAFGKIPVDMGVPGVDILTVSAHKMGGPVGAAALIVREGVPLTPLITGGGQEQGRRAGTENIAAIAGFARAVQSVDYAQMQQLSHFRDSFERAIMKIYPAVPVFGQHAPRLPNTSCLAMPGVASETQLMAFDLAGFCISAGSACSSGRIEPSHVLKAMGVAEQDAKCAIRVSLGWNNTGEEVEVFTRQWLSIAGKNVRESAKSQASS